MATHFTIEIHQLSGVQTFIYSTPILVLQDIQSYYADLPS